MCGWLIFSVSHLVSDCDPLVGKGAGEVVTPWRSVLRVFLLLCWSSGWRGRSP